VFNIDLPKMELDNMVCVHKEMGNYTIMSESKLSSSTSNDEVLSSTSEQVIYHLP